MIIWKLFKVFPVTGISRVHGAGQDYYPQGICLSTLTASENIHPTMLVTCSGTSLSLFPLFFRAYRATKKTGNRRITVYRVPSHGR